VADPVDFTNAFGKLEQAIRELVGAGDIKERTWVALEQPRGHDRGGGRGVGEESVLAVHVCGRGRVRRLARALGPFTAEEVAA
jgi:hypothetical protein